MKTTDKTAPMRPLFALLLGLLVGCTLATQPPATATPLPSPTPEPTPAPADGWRLLVPGIEGRTYQPNTPFSQVYVLRIDPTRFTFRAHYRPGAPLSVDEWQEALPGVVALVNANFFSVENTVLGLLVADGQVFGETYRDRGGTFLVQNGQPRVRSNIAEPYAGEPLEQAVQAFPMLVLNEQASFSQTGRASRRTVVAQDNQGRILLMATPLTGIALNDLSAWLPTTDLNIVTALNLDGGGSTMLYATVLDDQPLRLPAFDPVPAVLAVYPR